MEVDPAMFAKMLPAEQVFEEMLPYLETLDAQIDGIMNRSHFLSQTMLEVLGSVSPFFRC